MSEQPPGLGINLTFSFGVRSIFGTGPSEYKTVFLTLPSECDKSDSFYCPSEVHMSCCNDDEHYNR